MGRRTTALLGTSMLGLGLLAACGSDEPDTAGADTSGGDTSGAGEVATTSTDLGTYLVDGQGMTLYLFTEDSPGMSACTDECLENWPILPGEPEAGAGVDADLLGSIERDDGSVQATYDDQPLYYFAQDSEPGDVN